MPLSDHEKRLLEEMEQALASDDPRLVDVLNSGRIAPARIGLAVLAIVLGIATLLGGLIAKVTPVGIVGFIIALAGLVAILRSISLKAPRAPRFGGAFEERWDRRSHE